MTTPLRELTTLRVGGPPQKIVTATTEEEFTTAIAECDAAGEPLLVLGGGSNLVVADSDFPGTVVHDARREIHVPDISACAGVSVSITAGTIWDDVVSRCVTEGWVGVECLSGIPGSAGATPVQNVGAYGQEVGDVLASVRVWDRLENRIRMFAVGELELAYRDSVLKRTLLDATPRWVVLSMELQMRTGEMSAPIRYQQLASFLDVNLGDRVPLAEVRDAVLALRNQKGMVLNAADHDTWSAGSFFTNPILTAEAAGALPAEAPRYPTPNGQVKTSAAWLIEHAGIHRGYGLPGPAAVSTKHTLALTNRGKAAAADVVDLAREVRGAVQNQYGITLVPEPMLIGLEL